MDSPAEYKIFLNIILAPVDDGLRFTYSGDNFFYREISMISLIAALAVDRVIGMENAMQQVELRLLSVIEDSKAVSYDGIVRQSYSESRSLVYKDVTEYLTQKFTRNANYRCVFISSVGGDEPVHAYAAAPGTARLNLLRDYKSNMD